MFGYVKPAYGELRVREHELYKAYYCGLCRAMGRTTGQLSRFSLNYDLVFLAMMRQVFEGARTKLSLRRCPVHPVKKRPSVGMNGALSYASYASAILTAGKIRDDIADERAVRRAAARLELAACRTLRRRSKKSLPDLADFVCAHLARLREYELAGEKSVDTVSAVFGDLLSDVMSFGLEGDTHRVAASVGRSLGRIVYITDAADDAFRDIANGSYNPFAASLGSDICERREVYDLRGHRRVRGVLKRPAAEDVLCSASYIIRDLNAAAALADFSACPELRGIIENIILLGIPGELRQVLGLVPPPTAAADTKQ